MSGKSDAVGDYQTTVATLDEFRASRERWNKLVFSMAQPTVFLTWEWMHTWWEHFGGGRELLLLFVYRGTELAGILPLFRKGGYRPGDFLWFCAADDLYPDHLDLISAPADAAGCLASIDHFFSANERRWAAIEFPMVTLDSSIYGFLCAQTDNGPQSPYVSVSCSSVAHYIPLEGTFDSFFAALDKKQRYNLRSRRNRLYAEEGVRYTACQPGADGLNALVDLHRRRAARKGIVSSFGNERALSFHRAFIECAAPQQWVSFRFLETTNGPIAGAYNFALAGRTFSYQKGIDPAWERHGPGMVLLYELVQEAFQQKMQEYNFLQGAEAYKSEWTGYWRNLYTLRLYNRSVRGRLAAYVRGSRRLFKSLAHRRGL